MIDYILYPPRPCASRRVDPAYNHPIKQSTNQIQSSIFNLQPGKQETGSANARQDEPASDRMCQLAQEVRVQPGHTS